MIRASRNATSAAPALAYADARGRILFDAAADRVPLADDGVIRPPRPDELIPAPPGTVPAVLPGRAPLVADHAGTRARRSGRTRVALGALLPFGYTRLLLPAFERSADAPTLPLFGYAFACAVDDELHVAAARTDANPDWAPRALDSAALARRVADRCDRDPENRVLRQVALCATEYGCFTAQNVFLECGEAALPVSPRCNAACIGCISEQRPDSGVPAPQTRIVGETAVDEIVRVAVAHLERVDDGIVSFGQGCEGEPLLRATTIARAIERIRAARANGTVNCNTNGSRPRALRMLIDAGLQAVRISVNSFRPHVYTAYYRPVGYALDDVLESVRLAVAAGLRVSLNLLTHPGVTDDRAELEALDAFLARTPVAMIQTRALNIDPDVYFAAVGRPQAPLGMLEALARIRAHGVGVGNFTRSLPKVPALAADIVRV